MPQTILIVDDTPANLGVLVETLSDTGYQLMVAEDGEEALAQTEQTTPDLILLDVMMPGIDGFETCRRLKARAATRHVPVLFMTALNETADKVRAFAAGGVDYITKPIEHEEAMARIQTHLTLRRLQLEMQEQLALKERFMRIAGHDLRNPLCLILIASDLARRLAVAAQAAELTKYVDNITDSASQMRRIIDTFLEIRTPGPASFPSGRVDLGILAAAIARQHEHAAERKSIALATELAPALPLARCDAALAYQACVNFTSNALKFTPQGGRVTIRTRVTGEGVVRVEVHDSGPGVPASERPRLFQEHAQLSPRPTAGEESNGVGLAIVKHLIESQAGAVGAEFPPTGGSIFWFELPAR
jgi:two-component system sensor histidine kinase/response regulator